MSLAAASFYGKQTVGWEWKRETIEITQVSDDRCLDQDAGGGSEKGSEAGYTVNAEPARFPNGLDVKCEEKGEVRNNSMVSCSNDWRDGMTVT